MKATFNTLLAVVAALAIAGCASTPQQVRTDYPSMKVLSPTPYVWDNSKSVALNVAKMAEPAGVGVGMKDYATATEATNGQSSTTERVLGGVVMGLSQGVFGLLSDSTQSNRVDAALAWQPSLVDLIPVSEIGTDLNSQAFLKVRSIIGEQLKSALSKELPDLVWHGAYTPKRLTWSDTALYVFTTSACSKYMSFHSYNQDNVPPFVTRDFTKDMHEQNSLPSGYCLMSMKTAIAGTTIKDGINSYIVVSQISMGQNFIEHIYASYPGSIILPDAFEVPAYDMAAPISKTYPHAFVLRNGKFEYFVKP